VEFSYEDIILRKMSASLILALRRIPYNLTETYQENLDTIQENEPGILPFLETEFPVDQRKMTIYYPYVDQFVPVTYDLPAQVSPQLILESITNFYQQDLTDDNIAWLLSQGYSRSDLRERKAWNVLGTEVFFEGLEPYNGGWLIQLGT